MLEWVRLPPATSMSRDLEYIPTQELIDELFARCDHAAIVGLQCGVPCNDGRNTKLILRWKGNSFAIVGMASQLSNEIHREYREAARPVTDKDQP